MINRIDQSDLNRYAYLFKATTMNYLVLCVGVTLPYVAKFVYNKVKQFNELRNLVTFDNSGNPINSFVSSVYKTTSILYKSLEVRVYNLISNPDRVLFPWSINSGYNKSSYFKYIYHNMKWYKVPFIIKKGPNDREIICVRDESGYDVTPYILPFTGPKYDFFNMLITPQFFSMKKMTFLTTDGEYTFAHNEPIIFSKPIVPDFSVSKENENLTPPPMLSRSLTEM